MRVVLALNTVVALWLRHSDARQVSDLPESLGKIMRSKTFSSYPVLAEMFKVINGLAPGRRDFPASGPPSSAKSTLK